MAQVINTNSLSLLTQNNLNKSQGALNTAIERLSSGMRINSAKDDAAGQAIANRFTANIKGLSQAQRNANDGISLAQTTEGALNEINTNLQRVRELTVQSANGSNSTEDKVSIQAEIDQRLGEITRLSDQTDFNGTKVLKDGVGSLKFQVGANDGETISIDLKAINTTSLGLDGFSVEGAVSTTAAATVAGLEAAAYTSGTAGAVGSVSATNFVAGTVGATSTDYTQTVTTIDTAEEASVTFSAASVANVLDAVANGETVSIGATAPTAGDGDIYTYNATSGNYTSDLTAGGVVKTRAEMETALSGVAATVVAGGTSYAISAAGAVSETTGSAAVYADSTNANALTTSTGTTGVTEASTDTTVVYTVDNTTGAVTTSGASPVAVFSNSAGTGADAFTTTADAGATADPLKALDDALAVVDGLRGALGAVQNRFDSIISNLGTTITNLTSSRSRIEDADYATEVSNMTRANILQQAGTSVLAQANQTTQGILSLLR